MKKTKAERGQITYQLLGQETGKQKATPGTRVSLDTWNWFFPALSLESTHPSCGVQSGAWQYEPHPYTENHSLGSKAALGASEMIYKLLVPFWGRGFYHFCQTRKRALESEA